MLCGGVINASCRSDKKLLARNEPIPDGGMTKLRKQVLAERKAAGKADKQGGSSKKQKKNSAKGKEVAAGVGVGGSQKRKEAPGSIKGAAAGTKRRRLAKAEDDDE